MVRARHAAVHWDPQKKRWMVRIEAGSEVIKRAAPHAPRDAADESLRTLAVETAAQEGYALDPAVVAIAR